MANNQSHQTLTRDGVMTSDSLRLSEAQRKLLVDAASSVCKISICKDGGQPWYGTGFHFGGGWVMTNYHVIVDDEDQEETFYVSKASFNFPSIAEAIPGKKRSFISTYFETWKEDEEGQSPRKDLALIYVPELVERKELVGLYKYIADVSHGHPQKDQEVCLIHYGDSGEEQFSFGNITSIETLSRGTEWKSYYVNDAYCPAGSSGGPLLWFNEKGLLVLCGVNYMVTKNEKGAALLFRRRHWISDTVLFASRICSGIIPTYIGLAAELSTGDVRDTVLKTYHNTLMDLDRKAMTRRLLVFFKEDLQKVLKNVRSAY